MSDLSLLTTRAYAAATRLSTAYADGTAEDVIDDLEEADFALRKAVRAKLAEIGVDPAMLRAVIQ